MVWPPSLSDPIQPPTADHLDDRQAELATRPARMPSEASASGQAPLPGDDGTPDLVDNVRRYFGDHRLGNILSGVVAGAVEGATRGAGMCMFMLKPTALLPETAPATVASYGTCVGVIAAVNAVQSGVQGARQDPKVDYAWDNLETAGRRSVESMTAALLGAGVGTAIKAPAVLRAMNGVAKENTPLLMGMYDLAQSGVQLASQVKEAAVAVVWGASAASSVETLSREVHVYQALEKPPR